MSVERFGGNISNGPHMWSPDCRGTCTEYVLASDYDALETKLKEWSSRCLVSQCQSRIEQLEAAIRQHNDDCQSMCGVGDQEAVRCKYRPYFENTGRRCPECPVDFKIAFPVERETKP